MVDNLEDKTAGLDKQVAAGRLELVGHNEIVYKVDTPTQMVTNEFFALFYFYQRMIYMVWFYWSYLFTACAEYFIVLISASYNM